MKKWGPQNVIANRVAAKEFFKKEYSSERETDYQKRTYSLVNGQNYYLIKNTSVWVLG